MAGWPTLRAGDEHRNVRTLQHLLNHHGGSIEVDGRFGPATEEELKRFQGSVELEPDAIVSEPVWRLLVADLAMGQEGEAVKAAQLQLLYRRTLPDVDGKFGVKTDISVRRFQVLKQLPVDGIVTADTWRAMLADARLPGDATGGPGGGGQADPSDWRAQLLSKLRPGGMPPTGGGQGATRPR